MAREIPLTRGLIAIVDDEDYERMVAAGPWHATAPKCGTHYARHSVYLGGNRFAAVPMHQLVSGHRWVDHINGDGLDNRRANLRPVNRVLNLANSQRRRDNRSGFKGVHRQRDRFIAACAGQYLGSFGTAEDAARAYDTAAIAAWGDYARPNFPRLENAS